MILARRFFGIEDADDPPTTAVDRAHEAERQRGPPIAHDERVVLLVERDGRLDHDLTHACPAVVGEVAVQLLDPRFGREHQRDGRFHDGHRAVGSRASDVPTRSNDWGAVPRRGAGTRREGDREVPVGDRGREELRLRGRDRHRDRERARRLADPAATARVDGEHLRVGHDDRDLVGPREEHVDPVPGAEAAADRPRRVDRDAHRPQAVTGCSRSQRSPDHQLTRGDGRRRHLPAHRGRVVGAHRGGEEGGPHRHRLRPEVRRPHHLAGADLVGGDEDPGIALVLTQRGEREHDARPPRRRP